MDRRAFIGSMTGGLLAAPLAAEAQQPHALKAAKIGFLLGGTVSSPVIYIEPFKQTLREKGWIEGQNLTLVPRYAEGHYERLPVLARELLDLGIDVIVTEGTPPARAAKQIKSRRRTAREGSRARKSSPSNLSSRTLLNGCWRGASRIQIPDWPRSPPDGS